MTRRVSRRSALGAGAAFCAALTAPAGRPWAEDAAHPLAAYAWRARPILIFAPDAGDPRLAEQRARFAGRDAERADRACPLFEILPEQVLREGAPSAIGADAMRRRYRVAQDAFAVLLIGKDEGVKLRRTAPTDPNDIFALIDTMPMRRREMRERAG